MSRLPGRLLHVNVVGCGIFAAACGSSAATMATIGRISLPELAKRKYDDRMAIGSLACAGTLGIMIPPSITFIIYGVSAEVSIARLFAAGILPGVLLIVLFMGYIMIWALLEPRPDAAAPNRALPFLERYQARAAPHSDLPADRGGHRLDLHRRRDADRSPPRSASPAR